MLRPLRRVILLLACAGVGLPSARASTVVVPDDIATIQAALDARSDTVLVRAGVYDETPTVSRPVSLLGIGAERADFPRLAALRIQVERTAVLPPLFNFQRLEISGQVVTISDRGNCDFSFGQCALVGGVVDSSQYMDTGNISLLKCELDGDIMLMAHGWVRVDSCGGSGHILGCGAQPVLAVHGCHFEGDGTGYAIGSCDLAGAEVAGNTVRNYAVGITVYEGVLVHDNVVEDCNSIGIAVGGNSVRVERNVIRRGGQGIDAYAANELYVLENTVVATKGAGITIHEGDPVEVSGNVVMSCGREGVVIRDQSFRVQVSVSQNTSVMNARSGFAFHDCDLMYNTWARNIGYGNGAYGIEWRNISMGIVECDDWFGNALGRTDGVANDSTDLSVDPMFCNLDSADVKLNSASPLLGDSATCGQIGALAVGCGVTPTLVQRFTAGRVNDGVRVVWEVAMGATASAIWVERAEGSDGQGWTQPVMERAVEGATVVELDRNALPDHAYRYRLVARDGGKLIVLDPGILVEAQAPLVFTLGAVGPSPGGGPVRIAFTLAHEAATQIDVFDLLGRKVATPAKGVWPAGVQVVTWDGRTRDGQAAAPGMYVVRYAFPGGQERRRIIRVR